MIILKKRVGPVLFVLAILAVLAIYYPLRPYIMLRDAQHLIQVVEATHPAFLNLARFKPYQGEEYQLAKTRLLEAAENRMSITQFALECNRYLASLHDLHTDIDLHSVHLVSGLPLSFYWDVDGLWLESGSVAPEGARVLSIGGVNVEHIGEIVDAYIAYETESGRLFNRACYARSKEILILAGVTATKDIELLLQDGSMGTKTVFQNYVTMRSIPGGEYPSLTYRLTEDDTVVVISLNVCVIDANYQLMLDFLEQALRGGVRQIVFDVRWNPGGRDEYWDKIFAVMGITKSEHGQITRNSPYWPIKGTPAPSSYFAPVLKHKPNFRGYDLDIYVLVSSYTASAAVYFVAQIKDAELGTIIGATPRQAPSQFAYSPEVLHFTLPLTRVKGRISNSFLIRPDPSRDEKNEPVVDIEIAYGEDALERALQEIRNK
ncbi:MAG: S41 family peptidase [Symbiobacteriaceae bacterium]|nr:S41 family peptidase [Symbiobacteriaceae bacterium]